ncbi:unnamed protein product, partial [Musa banksii]
MGGCNSCYAASVVVDGTAKVVLPDGGLREYTRPVTAAHALGKDAACFFVCDADAMEFDAFVSAVGAEEELRPGQLYFVLPRTMLKYPLRAEDVAALALKASNALMGAAGRGAPGPLVFPLEPEDATGASSRNRREGGFGVIVLVVGVAVLCSAVHAVHRTLGSSERCGPSEGVRVEMDVRDLVGVGARSGGNVVFYPRTKRLHFTV